MNYRISEISAASPDMDKAAFQALVEDIRKQGQLVPIWKVGTEIIDGRKRLMACEALGIEPKLVDVSADQDPIALAFSMNIVRTHYTSSQRAMFAAKRATMSRSDAARIRHAKPNLVLHSHPPTILEAARQAGTGTGAVIVAKAIRRDAAPEVVAAIEAGHLTIHSAAQIVKTTAKPEQPAAVAAVLKASRGKSRNSPARPLGAAPMRQYKAKPANEQRERAVGVI